MSTSTRAKRSHNDGSATALRGSDRLTRRRVLNASGSVEIAKAPTAASSQPAASSFMSAPQWGVPCPAPFASTNTPTIPGPVLGIPSFASVKGCPPFPCFMPPPSFVMFMMQRFQQQQQHVQMQQHLQGMSLPGMPGALGLGWPGLPFPPGFMPPGCSMPYPSLPQASQHPAATSLAPSHCPVESNLACMSFNPVSLACDDSGRSCSSANPALTTAATMAGHSSHEDKADSNDSNAEPLSDVEFATFIDSFLIPGSGSEACLPPVGDSALDLHLDLGDLCGVDTYNILNTGSTDADQPCILDV